MTTTRQAPPIDHVLLAARSRDEAERELRRVGLATVAGHDLDGMGMGNFFVPLGQSMLEIHYPNGTPLAEGAPPFLALEQRMQAAHPDVPLLPVGWLVRVDSESALRERASAHGLPVVRSAPPDGVPSLVAGLGLAFRKPWLPLLIHWPQPAAERPMAASVAHRSEPTGALHLLVEGDAAEIREWCGAIPEHATVRPGSTGPLRLSVPTADGGAIDFGP